MNLKNKIAVGLNLVPVLVGTLAGIHYWLATSITRYHKQVIGVAWDTLAPGVKLLMLVLMKGTGHAFVVASVSITILLFIPFRQGQNWSRWAILAIGLFLYVPMFGGAVFVATSTGASSPWWLNLAMIIFLIAAFLISGDLKNKKQE